MTVLSAQAKLQLTVAKSKERLRLNSIKLFHFDSRDTIVINEAFRQVQSFVSGLHLTYGLTTSDILAALQAAHQAADEYYTMRHTEAWDTTFIIPQADIDADMKLFQEFNYDFTSLVKYSSAAYERASSTNKANWRPTASLRLVYDRFSVILVQKYQELTRETLQYY